MRGIEIGIVITGWGFLLLSGCGGHRCAEKVARSSCQGQGDKVQAAGSDQGKLSKVVIKQFNATGMSEEEVAGVSNKFCVEVSKRRNIDLVCAGDLRNLFQHQEDLIKFGACDQEECLAKLGEQLEADFIVQGVIDKVGEVLVFQVNLVDGRTGKVKTRFSREVPADKTEDLLGAAAVLAEKLSLEF